MRTKYDDLKTVRLFQGLDRTELAILARCVDYLWTEPGERLVEQGELNGTLYSIVQGAAAVWRDGEMKAVLGPGDTFGEITMERFGGATASVTALQRCELLVMSREQYRALRGSPAAHDRLQQLMETHLSAVAAG